MSKNCDESSEHFLKANSPIAWIKTVMKDFDHFLVDHAAAEKKAAGMAMSMVSHYPDKPELVKVMVDLAIEEMCHFREVTELIYERQQQLQNDEKDPYIHALRQQMSQGTEVYLLDRLIIGGIIEARGAERFKLVADALHEQDQPRLKKFYSAIARSEERHYELFMNLAYQYGDQQWVSHRTEELLNFEANLIQEIPIRARLH